jgi:hypothetical protein
VSAEKLPEQTRVVLVSVPYALKASDSDTLGGLPASAYALAGSQALLAPVTNTSSSAPSSASAPPGDQTAQRAAVQPVANAACSAVTSDGTATANHVAKFTSACNVENSLVFDNGTNLGVGTTSPVAFLDEQSSVTATAAGPNYGLRALTTMNPAAASSAAVYALFTDAQTAGSNPQSINFLSGFEYRTDHYGTGMLSSAYGGYGAVLNHSTGTINSATGLYTYLSNGATGAINTGFGLYVDQPLNSGGGTFSNYYGVYIRNPSAVTGAYGLYSAGGKNYFGGAVGIGTTTPGANLEVNGTSKFDGAITFASGQTFPIPAGGVTDAMLANPYSGVGSCASGTAVTGLTRNAAPTCTAVPGTGTVTSVGSGAGLMGGPITTSGTLSLNPNVSASTGTFSGSTSPVVSGTNTVSSSFGQLAATVSSVGDTGVYGIGSAYGVSGNSSAGEGVNGASTSGNGVNGISTSGNGVYGASTSGPGVTGSSTSDHGVSAWSSTASGVYGHSDGYFGVQGVSTNMTGVYGSGPIYGVYSFGNLGAVGTKSAVVALPDNRVVELYAMESPENWFEDFGSGQLRDGVGEVTLDPTFALTVNTGTNYHVFLTPKGDCEGLYVAGETATSFQVRELRGGKSNIAFDYRIVAKRRGYESLRMDQLETDAETAQKIREVALNRPAHRKLILPKPPALSKAPPAPPKVGGPPAPPAVVIPKPLEQPKLPAPPKVAAPPTAPAAVTPKPLEQPKTGAAPTVAVAVTPKPQEPPRTGAAPAISAAATPKPAKPVRPPGTSEPPKN